MKSKLTKFAKTATAGVVLALTFTLAGCAYHTGNPIGTVYQVGGPVKDVEVIGMIHVKCNEGEPVYQALMRAAEAKGGNGIANVVIDIERVKVGFWTDTHTKYGSALAIKYSNQNIVADSSAREGKVGIPSNLTSPYGFSYGINAAPK
jgi:hypothetical protein